MSRVLTTTRRITSPFGAFYLHVLHTPEGVLHRVDVSTPGTMHGKELGGVLESFVQAVNEEVETLRKDAVNEQ